MFVLSKRNKMKELKLEHISPYLPYDLKVEHENHIARITMLYMPAGTFKVDLWVVSMEDIKDPELSCSVNYKHVKPILRPLSDLTKEIEHDGEKFVLYNKLVDRYGFEYLQSHVKKREMFNVYSMSWAILSEMFKYHFDVFELIKQDLAIDINRI